MNTLELVFDFDEEAAIRYQRAILPWLRYSPFIGLIMIGCALYTMVMLALFDPRAPSEDISSPLLFGFGVMSCGLPLMSRWSMRRHFRRDPNANLQITWRINGARLSCETQGACSVIEWNKLMRIKEARDGFLLFVHPMAAQWLPKSAFESSTELDQFRTYIRESGVKTK